MEKSRENLRQDGQLPRIESRYQGHRQESEVKGAMLLSAISLPFAPPTMYIPRE